MLQNRLNTELQQQNAINDIEWSQKWNSFTRRSMCSTSALTILWWQSHARHFAVPWPLESLDLTLIDLWFWGYLKFKVHTPGPGDLSKLKDAIKKWSYTYAFCYVTFGTFIHNLPQAVRCGLRK